MSFEDREKCKEMRNDYLVGGLGKIFVGEIGDRENWEYIFGVKGREGGGGGEEVRRLEETMAGILGCIEKSEGGRAMLDGIKTGQRIEQLKKILGDVDDNQ